MVIQQYSVVILLVSSGLINTPIFSKCQNFSISRETVNQLGNTVQQVDKLQGKVRQSLKEMKIFLNGMGTVAANAVKELNNLKLK